MPLPRLARELNSAGCQLSYTAPGWRISRAGEPASLAGVSGGMGSGAVNGALKVEGRFPAALLLRVCASDGGADSWRFLLFRDAVSDREWRLLQRRLTLEVV